MKPAQSIATRIACSWNSGTPSVLPSTCSSSGVGIVDRLLALAPAQIGMHHVALDRAGPDDRDLDDEIVEGRGFSRGSIAICARLSIWNTPSVSALRIIA